MRVIFVAALVGLATVQAAPTGAGGTHEAAGFKRGSAGGSIAEASWKRAGAGEGARGANWKRAGAGEGARGANWKRNPENALRNLWKAVNVSRRWANSGSIEDLD